MTDLTAYFAQTMCAWFNTCGRDLPWRHKPSAYQVWVSELMLQQTQVAAVIPYYHRWMARFPDLASLARADIDDVLALWAGLGYYRRARYLHDGARYIAEHHGGEFPRTVDELRKIPGVGPYTAGAIAAFAFGLDVPAVDGNTERVYARFFGIDGDLSRGAPHRTLENVAQQIAGHGHAREVNQAVMDLGAGYCGRIPDCSSCPVAAHCFAFKNGRTESLPQKKIRPQKTEEFRAALVLSRPDGKILAARRNQNQLLGGLWEFPMIKITSGRESDRPQNLLIMRRPRTGQWLSFLANIFNAQICSLIRNWSCGTPDVEHIFTHIRMNAAIDRAELPADAELPDTAHTDNYDAFTWTDPDSVSSDFAVSTLMKKLLRQARSPKQKTLNLN